MIKSIWILVIAALAASAQDGAISASRIREHTKFLSSDLLEGRGVGVRGGELATEYIATQLALAGALPAGDHGTYFQSVPMVGVETQPTVELAATAGGKSVDFRWLDDFVGANPSQRPEERFEGDLVFVGHGISAPEWKWDDYKGVDVTGKVLLLLHQRAAFDRSGVFRRPRPHLLRPLDLQIRGGAAARGQGRDHHPHHPDGQLRLGRGAQLLGPRDAFPEAGSEREGAGLRGLDHARGGRPHAGTGGQDRG